jgi:hypothetical protein
MEQEGLVVAKYAAFHQLTTRSIKISVAVATSSKGERSLVGTVRNSFAVCGFNTNHAPGRRFL